MNSKQKGKRGELEWAAYCRQQGYDCRRTAQYCGNTGDASKGISIMMDTFSIKECPEYDPEEKREMPYKCHAE